MQTALILMTILGCDDSATDCHHIATLDQRWPTIELCDAVSERQLSSYASANFPVVVAVCQTPEEADIATAHEELEIRGVETGESDSTLAAITAPTPEELQEKTLAARAIDRVRNVLPTKEGIRTAFEKPVHVVEDSYSWIARKFSK